MSMGRNDVSIWVAGCRISCVVTSRRSVRAVAWRLQCLRFHELRSPIISAAWCLPPNFAATCSMTQPDHETGNERIRAQFGRMLCERIAASA